MLGSASGDLLRQSSESLAGRAALYELTPFSHHEVTTVERLWVRGGYPRAWLAKTDADAFTWLQQYVTTFLERDVPGLGLAGAPRRPASILDDAGARARSGAQPV